LARRQTGIPISSPTVIPVVDLFAGPGGLGEGFSAFESGNAAAFDVRLSIEKDAAACATLTLRKYFRRFAEPPEEFAAYFSGQLSKRELFAAYPGEAGQAHDATWQAELGKEPADSVARRVRRALGKRRDWLLLGGPPCQAYSVVGRSRMRKTHANFEADERHFLYREYLRIVADHEPAVFVLENVKGLLSSTHGGSRIVSRILDDLAAPGQAVGGSHDRALRYRLYALGHQQASLPWMEEGKTDGTEFLLQAEHYGIPQMRHRIFIVGVRSDVPGRPDVLAFRPAVSVSSVLSDLPPLRSALSRQKDSLADWRDAIAAMEGQDWLSGSSHTDLGRVAAKARKVIRLLQKTNLEPGKLYTSFSGSPACLSDWYRHNADGITLHESRAHMRDDLHRYLFSACFAEIHSRSPKLRDFPEELYPSHQNITRAVKGNLFDDRFRVQLADRPSTTITSHVSKDGHYYIHYDPLQCRSLTVREAARLQTFPDSYFFEGTRTQQYGQVGNAVPPLLARDIARVVFELLSTANRSSARDRAAQSPQLLRGYR
jgi:DNA (cytosine-5)-methyltransferase 1